MGNPLRNGVQLLCLETCIFGNLNEIAADAAQGVKGLTPRRFQGLTAVGAKIGYVRGGWRGVTFDEYLFTHQRMNLSP